MKNVLNLIIILTSVSGWSQDRRYVTYQFDKVGLQTYNVSILDMNLGELNEIESVVNFLLQNGVKFIVIRSSQLLEMNSTFDGLNVIVTDDELQVKYGNFSHTEDRLVTSFPIKINGGEHIAIKIAMSIDPSVGIKLDKFQGENIKMSYFGGENDITIASKQDILNYRYSEIVIITSLYLERKYLTPFEEDLCQSCKDLGIDAMYSSILLSNMINTLIKLDPNEWLIY